MNYPLPVPTRSRASYWCFGLALVLLAWALQVYALWSRNYVPLVDLPNHMARHHLEYVKLSGGDLPPFYEVEYRVLPNLGGDLMVPLLMTVLEPATACKLFLTLSVLLYWLGPALFILQHGGYRPPA